MSKTATPIVLSDDGNRHEPMREGEVFAVGALPISANRKNLIETDDTGILLTGEMLVSPLDHNPIIESVDGKLYLRVKNMLSPEDAVFKVSDNLLRANLSMTFDVASSRLSLLGKDNVVISELALPVAPGLPTEVEILQDYVPPKPDGFVENPYQRGTYLHMRFRTAEDKMTDIYLDMSKLVDVYTGSDAIDITDNVVSFKLAPGMGLVVDENGAGVDLASLVVADDPVIGVRDNQIYSQLALTTDNYDIVLQGIDGREVSRALLPLTGETLTAAEVLQDFTPPPPHGAETSPFPTSDYLHLHFDSTDGTERDLYVNFGNISGSSYIWGKFVDGSLPVGEELDKLLEDMPVGSFVRYKDPSDNIVYLTPEEADQRYMPLTGNQEIEGVKTFTESPIVPTPEAGDKSDKAATTQFVADALEAWDIDERNDVKLTGDQSVDGVKTFTDSPVVPTVPDGDVSGKAASTEFVANAVKQANDADDTVVRVTGDQSVDGVKTFTASPQVPTAPAGDNTDNAASTRFVTGAIATAHASAPTLVRTGGDQTIDGTKTFLQPPVVPTQPKGDSSTKAASTEFVQEAIADASLSDKTLIEADKRYVGLEGNQLVSGIKAFVDSPIVPTQPKGDSSTKAASTEFVAEALADLPDNIGGVWGKRIEGAIPVDPLLIHAIVDDMPAGAYVNFTGGGAGEEGDSSGITADMLGLGLKLQDGKIVLDIDPDSPLKLNDAGQLTLDTSKLATGVSSDTGNNLIAGSDGKPYYPNDLGTL